jgi:hypothetical protein
VVYLVTSDACGNISAVYSEEFTTDEYVVPKAIMLTRIDSQKVLVGINCTGIDTVLVAVGLYDTAGKLLEVTYSAWAGNSGYRDAERTYNSLLSGYVIKAFLLDLYNKKPLCECAGITIQ